MKNQLSSSFWISSVFGMFLTIVILTSCDSHSRSKKNEILKKVQIHYFFSDGGTFEPLKEYQKGGWFMFNATMIEVENFLLSKGFNKVTRIHERSDEIRDVSDFTQFAVPDRINSELNGQYLRFRGDYGEFGVNGIYEYRSNKLVVCFYGR